MKEFLIVAIIVVAAGLTTVALLKKLKNYIDKRDRLNMSFWMEFKNDLILALRTPIKYPEDEKEETPPPSQDNFTQAEKEMIDTFSMVYGPQFYGDIARFMNIWGQSLYSAGLLIQRQMLSQPAPGDSYRDMILDVLDSLPDTRKALLVIANEVQRIARHYNMSSGEVVAFIAPMYRVSMRTHTSVALQLVIYKDIGVARLKDKRFTDFTISQLSNGDLVLIGHEAMQDKSNDEVDSEILGYKLKDELERRIETGQFGDKSMQEIRSISMRLKSHLNLARDEEGDLLYEADKHVEKITNHIDEVLKLYHERVNQ